MKISQGQEFGIVDIALDSIYKEVQNIVASNNTDVIMRQFTVMADTGTDLEVYTLSM